MVAAIFLAGSCALTVEPSLLLDPALQLRPSQWYTVDKSYDPDSNPELLLLFHSGNTLMEQDTTVHCPAGTLVS